jgi:group I intron endonuclease
MKSLVYCVKNKINGNEYVGFTSQPLKTRWLQHIHDSKRCDYPLHNAINKYGSDNFDVFVLQEYDSIEEGLAGEIFWIKEKNTQRPNGYNITPGGNLGGFYFLSEEEKSLVAQKRANDLKNNGYWTEEKVKTKVTELQAGRKNKIEKIKKDQSERMKKKHSLLREVKQKKLTEEYQKYLEQKPACCHRGCGKPAVFLTSGKYTNGIRIWVCHKYSGACSATTEKRIKSSQKTIMSWTPEKRSERAKNAWANKTQEERSAIAKKGAETLRKKREQNKKQPE